MLTGKESIYLAALDAEKLRRRGAGSGVDAMQASESWLARDCLCSSTGKLKPLANLRGPGEVKLALAPSVVKGENEVCVLLRAVAIRNLQDPHDWYVIGSAIVLKVDMVGKLQQPGALLPQQQLLEADPVEAHEPIASAASEDGREGEDAGQGSPCGVSMQKLIDFHLDIQADLERYCNTHRLCAHGGRHRSYHVCMMDPCPYRPINKPRFDDHRGLLFVSRSSLDEEESEELEKLVPDMHLVVRRYVWPTDKGTAKSGPLAPDPQRPPKIGTYVAHSWAEPFEELVQTLQRALDREETVFVPGLMMGSGSVIHGRSGGAGELEHRPFAGALRKAERLVVVADRTLGFLQCLWCAFEVAKAKEWLLTTLVWPHHAAEIGKLKDAISHLDLEAASRAVPSAAAAPTAEPEELRSVLVAAIQGRLPDLEASSRQLRTFLQSRLHCFVSALQDANEFREFSPERFRRLCAEYERRAVLRETSREHSRYAEEREAEDQERDRALARLGAAAEAEKEARAAEAQRAERYEHQLQQAAEEDAVLQGRHDAAEARAQQAEAALEEAKSRIDQLQADLEMERASVAEDRRVLAEVEQDAANSILHIQDLEEKRKQEVEKHGMEREDVAMHTALKQQAAAGQIEELREALRLAEERASSAEGQAKDLTDKLAQVKEARRANEEDEQRSQLSQSNSFGTESGGALAAKKQYFWGARNQSQELFVPAPGQNTASSLANTFASGAKFFRGMGHVGHASSSKGKEAKEVREAKEAKEPKEAKEAMEVKEVKEVKEDKDKHSLHFGASVQAARAAQTLLNPLHAVPGKSLLGDGLQYFSNKVGLTAGTPEAARTPEFKSELSGDEKMGDREHAFQADGTASSPITPTDSERSPSKSKIPRRHSAGNPASGALSFMMKIPKTIGGGEDSGSPSPR